MAEKRQETVAAKRIQIVASIRPVALIAEDILQRAKLNQKLDTISVTVNTLLPPGMTPHHMSLSVHQLELLKKGDLILWIGDDLEPYLAGIAKERGSAAIDLSGLAGVNWPEASVESDHHHHHQDMHLWLDPNNGLVIAEAFVDALGKLMPGASDDLADALNLYRQDISKLIETHRQWLQPLALKAGKPAVFHDSLNHFLARYQLQQAFALTSVPEQQLGMRRLLELKRENPACLLADVEEMELAQGYANKFGWVLLELDILAMNAETDSYLSYQQRIAKTLVKCLQR